MHEPTPEGRGSTMTSGLVQGWLSRHLSGPITPHVDAFHLSHHPAAENGKEFKD